MQLWTWLFNIQLKNAFLNQIICQRPYRIEQTSVQTITQVKHHRDPSVLGWVTVWLAFHTFRPSLHCLSSSLNFLSSKIFLWHSLNCKETRFIKSGWIMKLFLIFKFCLYQSNCNCIVVLHWLHDSYLWSQIKCNSAVLIHIIRLYNLYVVFMHHRLKLHMPEFIKYGFTWYQLPWDAKTFKKIRKPNNSGELTVVNTKSNSELE